MTQKIQGEKGLCYGKTGRRFNESEEAQRSRRKKREEKKGTDRRRSVVLLAGPVLLWPMIHCK